MGPPEIWKTLLFRKKIIFAHLPLKTFEKPNNVIEGKKKNRGPSETNFLVLPPVPSTRVGIVSDPPMPQLFMTHSIVLIYIVVKILEFVSQILRLITNSMEKDLYLYNQFN